MKILVSGASGRVGGEVFARLGEAGVEVRGGSRHPGTAGLPAGTAVAFDLTDPATLGPALDGVDAVFLYASSEELQPFVDAARATGSPRVVLLSSGSVVGLVGSPDSAMAAHHRALEDAITASGLPSTFVRGGYYATNTLPWAAQVRSGGSFPLPYPETRLAPVHEKDLADVAVAALTGDGLTGRAVAVTGPVNLTQREMVATIGRVLGRSLDVVGLTGEQARQQMHTMYPTLVADQLSAFLAEQVDDPAPAVDAVEPITGRPARSFETWVTDHVDDFR